MIATFIDHQKERQDLEFAVVAGGFNFIPSNTEVESPYHEMFVKIGIDLTGKALGIGYTILSTDGTRNPEFEGNGQVISRALETVQIIDYQYFVV